MKRVLDSERINEIFKSIYKDIDIESVLKKKLVQQKLERYEEQLEFDLNIIRENGFEPYFKLMYLIEEKVKEEKNTAVIIDSNCIIRDTITPFLLGITKNTSISSTDYKWKDLESSLKLNEIIHVIVPKSYYNTIVEYTKGLFTNIEVEEIVNETKIIALGNTDNVKMEIRIEGMEILDMLKRIL